MLKWCKYLDRYPDGCWHCWHCWCAGTRGHCSLQLQFEEFKKIMLIVECWLLTPALTRAGRGSDGFPEQVVSRDWSQDCVTLSLSRNIGAIIWSCSHDIIDCISSNLQSWWQDIKMVQLYTTILAWKSPFIHIIHIHKLSLVLFIHNKYMKNSHMYIGISRCRW